MKLFFKMCVLLCCCCILNCKKIEKINGVSFVSSQDAISITHIQPVLNIHANYASIMPFGFIRELSHPDIQYNSDRQWFGETKSGIEQYADALHKQRIKVMVKPQIWVWQGEFTGFIKMATEDDWKTLETSYTKFILDYAEVAQTTNAEILCIGTELETFIDERPAYWHQLIKDIRTVYKGKLTYAANWNEFERTPFWDELDYIGVDAYFPLSDKQTPTVEECKLGWQPHKLLLKQFSERYKKPILFTEFGYRSVDFAAKAPWKADRDMTVVNLQAQTNAMQSLFDEVWDEDWFAGGFVWKWFHSHNEVGGNENSQFTPQNKPVEQIIKNEYSKY